MREIRIYVEGAGKGSGASLRKGFRAFLKDFWEHARAKKLRLSITACGPKGVACEDFERAERSHPAAFNVLLIDSDRPMNVQCRHDERRHFMVQLMESWLIADVEALAAYYGNGFNANAVPPTVDVEDIPKEIVISALHKATRSTKKGTYHKITHGFKLLELTDASTVRARAAHCERLFRTLENLLRAAGEE